MTSEGVTPTSTPVTTHRAIILSIPTSHTDTANMTHHTLLHCWDTSSQQFLQSQCTTNHSDLSLPLPKLGAEDVAIWVQDYSVCFDWRLRSHLLSPAPASHWDRKRQCAQAPLHLLQLKTPVPCQTAAHIQDLCLKSHNTSTGSTWTVEQSVSNQNTCAYARTYTHLTSPFNVFSLPQTRSSNAMFFMLRQLWSATLCILKHQ